MDEIEFEIMDEGFDDSSTSVTFGIKSPEHSILTIYNDVSKVHVCGLSDEAMATDPRLVLMNILASADPEVLKGMELEVVVEHE